MTKYMHMHMYQFGGYRPQIGGGIGTMPWCSLAGLTSAWGYSVPELPARPTM